MSEKRILLAQMDSELVAKEIGDFVLQKVLGFGKTGGVIGLSGGVDSTTAAALAKTAFDSYNNNPKQHLELVGYMLPATTNNKKDTEEGIKVAERLGIRYECHNIEPIVESYRTTNPEAFESEYDKGNLMSRIRANILSTKSATENKVLIGTGNKDEDYGIGYYTLFGDGAVHISPIGALPKRLVRQMARHLGFNEIAEKEPTAGLEHGQTDFGDLGYSYDAIELVLEGRCQGFEPRELVEHEQVREAIEPELKHSKFESVEDAVKDILWRHYNVALPKAELLHPPIAKISLRYE